MPLRSYRIYLTLGLVFAMAPLCRAEDAAPAPPPAAVTDSTTTTPDTPQAAITHGDVRLEADSITGNAHESAVAAEGHVTVTSPHGILTADSAVLNLTTRAGLMHGARGTVGAFRFFAHELRMNTDNRNAIHGAQLTTCTKHHPHFELRARDLTLSPDDMCVARHVSLLVGGHKLFTIPYLRTNLNKSKEPGNRPGVIVGNSGLDGTYLGANIRQDLGANTELSASGRYGTAGVLRGGLFIKHTFDQPVPCQGDVTLAITHREDVPNQLISNGSIDEETLEELTISRRPALEVTFAPIKLPQPLHGYTLRLGGGFGRYHEDPTNVNADRGQAWGVIRTPDYVRGKFQLHAEYGMNNMVYTGQLHHHAYIGQITLESSPAEETSYYNLSYLSRRESGRTPFLFDRVLIPNELFAEIETPLPHGSPWRLGAWNRYDLSRGKIRDFNLSVIYRTDCLSYALSYHRATESVGIGIVLNAFGSFRKGAGSVVFTQ